MLKIQQMILTHISNATKQILRFMIRRISTTSPDHQLPQQGEQAISQRVGSSVGQRRPLAAVPVCSTTSGVWRSSFSTGRPLVTAQPINTSETINLPTIYRTTACSTLKSISEDRPSTLLLQQKIPAFAREQWEATAGPRFRLRSIATCHCFRVN